MSLTGFGGYFLAQSRNWQEIIHAPNPGAYFAVVAGLITLFVLVHDSGFWNTRYLLSTYAVVVGVVIIIEVAAAILLLVYFKQVRIYLSSHRWK